MVLNVDTQGAPKRTTLRGLTVGSLPVKTGDYRRPCIVFGREFASWIPALHELGLRCVWVCLTGASTFSSLIQTLVSEDCTITTQAGDEGTVFPRIHCQPTIGLVEGRVPGFAYEVCDNLGVHTLLSTKGIRRPPSHWQFHSRTTLSHSEVGGITNGHVCITAISCRALSIADTVQAPVYAPRDASTVLGLKANCFSFRPAPEAASMKLLRVVKLGTQGRDPYYHGGGLLPFPLTNRTLVLTPTLFAPKRHWGLRCLGAQEALECLDWPVALALSSSSLKRPPLQSLLPLKCLVNGFRALLGTSFDQRIDQGNEVRKRHHSGELGTSINQRIDQGNDVRKRAVLGPSLDQLIDQRNKVRKRHHSDEIGTSVDQRIDQGTDVRKQAVLGPSLDQRIDQGDEARKRHHSGEMGTSVDQRIAQGIDVRKRHHSGGKLLRPSNANAAISKATSRQDDNAAIAKAASSPGQVAEDATNAPGSTHGGGCFSLPSSASSTPITEVLPVATGAAREARERKAVKSDDAAIPEYLWREHLLEDAPTSLGATLNNLGTEKRKNFLDLITPLFQGRMLLWWKRRVTSSFFLWVRTRYPQVSRLSHSYGQVVQYCSTFKGYLWSSSSPTGGKQDYLRWWRGSRLVCPKDFEAGHDAVLRAARSTWNEWSDGSRPFHWRWPEEYQETIRDGLRVHFKGPQPSYKKPQRDTEDPVIKSKVLEKLQKVRSRRYISTGFVSSLTFFFAVPKGSDDIRMVYDGTVSGLNDVIWVPWFPLPTIRSHLRAVDENTFMADVDLGEMFLNFVLHESVRSLAGVDLTHYLPSGSEKVQWECWMRAAMGLTSSPYQAVQAMAFAEEMIRGDRNDISNIYRWSKVTLNLPGMELFNNAKPWVMKVREDDGKLAADLFIYVDDLRPTGNSKCEAWRAGKRAASVCNHLGIQDAPRKRRDGKQASGAWAGALVKAGSDGVFVLVAQDKWNKAKGYLEEVRLMLVQRPHKMNRKRLEIIRGFLNYLAQTYRCMASYLIGFHMTIDGWRKGRDEEGWRLPRKHTILLDNEEQDWSNEDLPAEVNVPIEVRAAPRFKDDVKALQLLCEADEPVLKRVRCNRIGKVYYGFGDASKASFGATIEIEGVIHFSYGQWSTEASEMMSSNWRELNNLVESLETICLEHQLGGSEIFIFTDNSTAESAYWKGTSTSKLLFELILRLKKLEMDHDLILHVIHVSGKRMIAQGTDGISRGDHSTGVMRGKPMSSFIPLHLSAFEREPRLQSLLESSMGNMKYSTLTPEGWFDEGHKLGNFIWSPPPSAADVVVEELGRARLKRPQCFHLIVVPRLMTGRWRRLMGRTTDFYFVMDWENTWPIASHFEPALIFVCLPYRSFSPNFPERLKLLDQLRRTLLPERVSEIPEVRRGHLLRKFWGQARSLCTL